MSSARRKSGKKASRGQDDDHAAIVLLLTVADTTWRIFTPVIIMTVIGIWADLKFATSPWITIILVIVGFVIAGFLIAAQLRKVKD